MGRWVALLFFLVLHEHISSQPITEESSNDRSPRQLEECCPCGDGAGRSSAAAPAVSLEDCPCRLPDADARGASSIFFPTAVRPSGTFLRPDERKEDLKPIFNPEVDLASSVLQTLREVTDEEYKDALARDAARSAAKAAEEIVFGDASPQESANIVTVIVRPEVSDDEYDVIPQPSHIQQSRCIHPLKSTRFDLSQARMAPKERVRVAKVRPGLFHRLYDRDSYVGASSINEQIVPVNEDTQPRINHSPLKLTSHTNEDCNNNQVSDVGSVTLKNKLREYDLGVSPLLQRLRDKTTKSLSRIPKFKLENSKPRDKNEDQRLAPSTIDEQATKRVPFFRTNSVLENIKPKQTPLSLPNLLNLRDVELLPLRDIINKDVENNKPKLMLPSISGRHDYMNSARIEKVEIDNMPETPLYSAANDNINDPEGSSSIANPRVIFENETKTDDNCDVGTSEWKYNAQSKETTENFATNENFDNLPTNKNEATDNFDNDNDCVESKNVDEDDSITNENIIYNTKIESNDDVTTKNTQQIEKSVPEDSCDQDEESNDNFEIISNRSKLKLLDPISINKTLSEIKQNIARKIEDFNNFKASKRNNNTPNRETVNTNVGSNNMTMPKDENLEEDCQENTSLPNTTVEPDIIDTTITSTTEINLPDFKDNDNSTTSNLNVIGDTAEAASECSNNVVSFQDLQTLSDSMLQQEAQQRSLKDNNCNNVSENLIPSENGNMVVEQENISDKSTESEDDSKETLEGNEKVTCNANLESLTYEPKQTDADVEASNINVNNIEEASTLLEQKPIQQPISNVLNLPEITDVLKLPPLDPLHGLNDIKEKITTLFDKNNKDVKDYLLPEIKSISQIQDALNPVMLTDASSLNFHSKISPSKLLEDLNIDEFKSKPQSNIRKIGIQSFKSKLPLPKELVFEPIKLSSTFKGGAVRSDPLGIISNVNSFNEHIIDSPLEATNNIHSTIRNKQKALESRLRQMANNNLKLRSPSLFETISRNHEDMNDKLKALHMDFNDRIETMRNELLDRPNLLSIGSRSGKSNVRHSSTLNKQTKSKISPIKHNWQASSKRVSQKSELYNHKLAQQKPSKINSPSKFIEGKKFKMRTAASVPIPRTIPVPELRNTPATTSPFSLQTQFKEPLANLGRQTINLQNTNPFLKLKKDSNIKVSFSSTPRPEMRHGHTFKNSFRYDNIEKASEIFPSQVKLEDYKASSSGISQSKPVGKERTSFKNVKEDIQKELPLRRFEIIDEDNPKVSEARIPSSKGTLQSWPKATESSFLSKVREAVQARVSKLSPLRSSNQFKTKLHKDFKDVEPEVDMALLASENKQAVIGSSLKENVSYNCKMVCTKH